MSTDGNKKNLGCLISFVTNTEKSCSIELLVSKFCCHKIRVSPQAIFTAHWTGNA